MSDKVKVVFEVSKIDGSVTVTSSPSTLSSVESSLNSPVKYAKVFVYDVNDMTMLSKKRIERNKKERSNIPVHLLSDKIEEMLSKMELSDSNQFENTVFNIQQLKNDTRDDIQAKYCILKKFYDLKANAIRNQDIPKMDNGEWKEKFQDLSVFGDRWKCVRQCLQLVNEISNQSSNTKYANVVLTEDGIAHGAGQLLISQLSSEVPIENIYSKGLMSVESVLEIIQKRFGEQCKLIIVTSNPDTLEAAKKLLIPVWHIFCNMDFDDLYYYQRDFWVMKKEQNQMISTPMKEDKADTQAQDMALIPAAQVRSQEDLFHVPTRDEQMLQRLLITGRNGHVSTAMLNNMQRQQKQFEHDQRIAQQRFHQSHQQVNSFYQRLQQQEAFRAAAAQVQMNTQPGCRLNAQQEKAIQYQLFLIRQQQHEARAQAYAGRAQLKQQL